MAKARRKAKATRKSETPLKTKAATARNTKAARTAETPRKEAAAPVSKARRDGKRPARIFIVDDHCVARQGIAMLIERQEGMEVCGSADSALEALRLLPGADPDVAIVDLSLKGSSGLELIKDLQVRHPKVRILVLSMHDETLYAERVLRAGARGYVSKDESADKVVEAIGTVLKGEVRLSEAMASRMISRMVGGHGETGRSPIDALTDRELEVFEMIGSGFGTREIAETLHRSVKTIETHRERIKEKLNLVNAAELVKHAIQWVQSEREGA